MRVRFIGITICLLAVAGAVVTTSTESVASLRPLVLRPAANTFVSMLPACGCGKSTELDVFSTSDGRRLGRLAPVPSEGFEVATPSATSAGRLYVTMTSAGRCSKTGYMECPHWIAGSCGNEVRTLAPGHAGLQLAFDIAGSEKIGQVVPSPHGRQVAFDMSPCVSPTGTAGMYIRSLRRGGTRAVLSSSNICDGYGPAAWSSNASEIAFPYEPAGGKPMEMAGGFGCPEGRRNYLVIASTRPNPSSEVDVAAGAGCVFEAVAFDMAGVVAAEGCSKGGPKGQVAPNVGDAFLLQYSRTGHLKARIALKRGLEQAVLSTEPLTGRVLVTQDRPANGPYPEQDLVWEFNGTRLREVAHYRADDAPQVLAVAW
jgi:hypothetical protein